MLELCSFSTWRLCVPKKHGRGTDVGFIHVRNPKANPLTCSRLKVQAGISAQQCRTQHSHGCDVLPLPAVSAIARHTLQCAARGAWTPRCAASEVAPRGLERLESKPCRESEHSRASGRWTASGIGSRSGQTPHQNSVGASTTIGAHAWLETSQLGVITPQTRTLLTAPLAVPPVRSLVATRNYY